MMKLISNNQPLAICYDSWTDDISVEGRSIRHVVTHYEYDNPVSGVPSRQYEVELLNTELTAEQLSDLKQFIQTSGYETLEDTYGAPEGHRYYPYRLTIKSGDLRKDILYRSNPSYEEPPPTFRAIERYLFELSEQIRRPTSEALRIRYDSWIDDITVEEQHLRHVVTRYEFESPISPVPSRWYTTVVTDADLSDEEWTALKRFVRDSGFETLADSYGAPEGRRYYPYNLIIAWGDSIKEVQYRSNPSYDQPPEIFWEVERYLKTLSDRVRELTPSLESEATVPQ